MIRNKVPYNCAAAGCSLGISGALIGRWRKELENTAVEAIPGKRTAEQQRIHDLEAEIRKLQMEREILKKAPVYGSFGSLDLNKLNELSKFSLIRDPWMPDCADRDQVVRFLFARPALQLRSDFTSRWTSVTKVPPLHLFSYEHHGVEKKISNSKRKADLRYDHSIIYYFESLSSDG